MLRLDGTHSGLFGAFALVLVDVLLVRRPDRDRVVGDKLLIYNGNGTMGWQVQRVHGPH